MKIEELIYKISESASRGEDFLFAFNYELDEGLFILNPLKQNNILFRVGSISNIVNAGRKNLLNEVKNPLIQRYAMPYDRYKEAFDKIYLGLYEGRSFLSNLTIRTKIDINVSLETIANTATSPYVLYVPNRFCCFSPERFIKISQDAVISSNPMKGTIDASIKDAQTVLLSDQKELQEHYTVVDLIRSDLSRVATNIRVPRLRYIDSLNLVGKQILQLSSEIVADLPKNYLSNLGQIIYDLLPAGSICGAPKPATLRLIADAESCRRDFYTGVFGYFDGRELDSAVAIRFIEQNDGNFYFRSGGGITINSQCRSEYEEALLKINLTT